jgi:hypothetical protein
MYALGLWTEVLYCQAIVTIRRVAVRVHIHANCQGIPLAGMLKEVYPDWNVTNFEVQGTKIIEQIEDHCAWIRSADVVISQPIHPGYGNRVELSTPWIRENVRADAAYITIPSVYFTGHNLGLDVVSLPGLPLFSNLLICHLVAHGCSPDLAVKLLLSGNLLRDSEIETEIQLTLDETMNRETADGIDIKISPFFEQNCRSKVMMHTYNHPLREMMTVIANDVLSWLGQSERVQIEGYDYQPFLHVPPLPAVARFLRAHGGDGAVTEEDNIVWMLSDKPMTQDEFYRDIATHLSEIPRDELFDVIAKRWPGVELLRRLARQGSSIPGIERWLPA